MSGQSLSGTTQAHGQILGIACACLALLGTFASSIPVAAPPASASPALGGFGSGPSSSISAAKQLACRCSLPLRIALLVGLGLSALGSLLLLDQVRAEAHRSVQEVGTRGDVWCLMLLLQFMSLPDWLSCSLITSASMCAGPGVSYTVIPRMHESMSTPCPNHIVREQALSWILHLPNGRVMYVER